MSLSIKLGNFLYKNAFAIYNPLYSQFKTRQDTFEIELLEKNIKPGDTVLDIGANIGFYAKLLSKKVGSTGKVHCFEPDEKNFLHLKKNTNGLSNVVLLNKAVGPKTETIKIYTSKELNVDHRTYKPEEFEKEIEIEAVSIDGYLATLQNAKVDVIKMDIQGFEMQAIKGMTNVLEQNPAVKIISEFWPYGLKMAGSSVSDYFNYLINKGFNCYLLEKKTLRKLDAAFVKTLESLGKEHYFNIFASRSHV